MNRAFTVMFALALCASPLAADEAKKATEPAAPQDSALVAAAKRANRLGKKPKHVITNETLKEAGANAHVTTTESQKKIELPKAPVRPSPEMIALKDRADQRKAEEAAIEKKKKAEEEQKNLAAMRVRYGEETGVGEGDTGLAEDFAGRPEDAQQQDPNKPAPPPAPPTSTAPPLL